MKLFNPNHPKYIKIAVIFVCGAIPGALIGVPNNPIWLTILLSFIAGGAMGLYLWLSGYRWRDDVNAAD